MTVLKIFDPVLRSPESKGLLAFMAELEGDFAAFAKSQTGFLSQLSDYVLTGSGKRVRPGLVYVCSQFGSSDAALSQSSKGGGHAAGMRSPAEAVKQVALAVELIHIATLIHDDLVDEAAMRRQKPTVGVKFGEGAAVLLGDFVYAQAFQRLSTLNDPELLRLFSDTTMSMCEGEIGQLERRYYFDLSEEEYLSFLDKKTASLMAASSRAGGRLAGLPIAQQDALDVFGRKIGIAFQIVDDILDLEGEEALTGKTLRTDLSHGKMTLPLIHYVSQLRAEADRASFFETLKNPNGHAAELIRRLEQAGSMAYGRRRVATLLAEAEEALSRLPDHPSRRLLADIARRLSDRRA